MEQPIDFGQGGGEGVYSPGRRDCSMTVQHPQNKLNKLQTLACGGRQGWKLTRKMWQFEKVGGSGGVEERGIWTLTRTSRGLDRVMLQV